MLPRVCTRAAPGRLFAVVARYLPGWRSTQRPRFGARRYPKCVDVIAWDNKRPGMGKRSRHRGDYLAALQKKPVTPKTWCDHGIASRWEEKVDRTLHPHVKPISLTKRLIGAVT